MIRIRKVYRLELAHILATSYTAACRGSIHGHSYVVEVFLETDCLDEHNMVRDFGSLEKVKEHLMQFDHALIVPAASLMAKKLRRVYGCYLRMLDGWNCRFHIWDKNPTAEEMSSRWLRELRRIEPLICGVRVHETATGYAQDGDC